MKKLFAFLSLMSFAIAAQSQVLESRQMTLGDEQITVVWYSFKCYVAKGEGTKVRFFDAGGNVVVTACRTGVVRSQLFILLAMEPLSQHSSNAVAAYSGKPN